MRPKRRFSILIVDDEPENIQLINSLLEENQYDIEFATNGVQALEWAKSQDFDLILLDVMMPEMSGFEVCRILKSDKDLKHVPVIFLTAKVETEDIVNGFEAGGADYITKPFNAAELLARIKLHVEVKTLRGLIPICAHCKNVRNDQGLWDDIVNYLSEHSAASFSHGICTDCMKRLYGEWCEDDD